MGVSSVTRGEQRLHCYGSTSTSRLVGMLDPKPQCAREKVIIELYSTQRLLYSPSHAFGDRKAGPLTLCFHSQESKLADFEHNELSGWQ